MAYAAVVVSPLRAAFELVALAPSIYVALAILTAAWTVVLLAAWRHFWLERLLQIDPETDS